MQSSGAEKNHWPLMRNNLARADLDRAIELLSREDPVLTMSEEVAAFEREWSDWLGVERSVFVNSGSSANLLTMMALARRTGPGEVIVSPLNWASDISSVLFAGFVPVFVDIDLATLAMNPGGVVAAITPRTRAVLLTHVLGFPGLDDRLTGELSRRAIPMIEDTCESYGATWRGKKLGTFGLASNFSFYYAHHLSTIEGGMVSTADLDFDQVVRMLRGHGLVREAGSRSLRDEYARRHPDLSSDFIFALAGFNMRPTEIQAAIGRSQLARLDENNRRRKRNFEIFLANLDRSKYFVDFAAAGSCNYAFTLLLAQPDPRLAAGVMDSLARRGVEFRRGLSGGGNQLRQPYLAGVVAQGAHLRYPNTEHVHFHGFYIGNYPSLEEERILELCRVLNEVAPRDP